MKRYLLTEKDMVILNAALAKLQSIQAVALSALILGTLALVAGMVAILVVTL